MSSTPGTPGGPTLPSTPPPTGGAAPAAAPSATINKPGAAELAITGLVLLQPFDPRKVVTIGGRKVIENIGKVRAESVIRSLAALVEAEAFMGLKLQAGGLVRDLMGGKAEDMRPETNVGPAWTWIPRILLTLVLLLLALFCPGMAWAIRMAFIGFAIATYFGGKQEIEPGFVGIPKVFGRMVMSKIASHGSYWTLPHIFDFEVVDMRPIEIEFKEKAGDKGDTRFKAVAGISDKATDKLPEGDVAKQIEEHFAEDSGCNVRLVDIAEAMFTNRKIVEAHERILEANAQLAEMAVELEKDKIEAQRIETKVRAGVDANLIQMETMLEQGANININANVVSGATDADRAISMMNAVRGAVVVAPGVGGQPQGQGGGGKRRNKKNRRGGGGPQGGGNQGGGQPRRNP